MVDAMVGAQGSGPGNASGTILRASIAGRSDDSRGLRNPRCAHESHRRHAAKRRGVSDCQESGCSFLCLLRQVS